MKYREIYNLFCEHERNSPKHHLTAYITFAPESFAPGSNYTERERTYVVSSDNKAFRPRISGFSIFGSCLDGKSDPCVRLDQYIPDAYGGKDGWIVEDCCLVGWLLFSVNERDLLQPELYYRRENAVEAMLRKLSETRDDESYEDIKALFDKEQGEVEEDGWGTTCDSAWLNDSRTGNWDWTIRIIRIYSPLHIAMDDIDGEVQDHV